MTDNIAVEVKQLVKRYGKLVALDHFNLSVYKGEILGLLGPNGCGKTTLINSILGLLTYDKGEIDVFGEELKPNSYKIKQRIGVVPQNVALFEELTVFENIDFFCGLYIEDKAERRRLVNEAIKFVELDKYSKFIPKKLSGGLKRRLNIACGIAHQPDLIFMDEPTVAVDAQSRNFILEGIKRLNENGATIVYTTHYLDEAEQISDRVVIMDSGQNIADGTLEQLQQKVNQGEIINIELFDISPEQIEEMRELPNLNTIEKTGKNKWRLVFDEGNNHVVQLVKFIEEHELSYTQLYSQMPDLNSIFLELTGKELRDQ